MADANAATARAFSVGGKVEGWLETKVGGMA